MLGSIDIIAATRSGLLVDNDLDDPDNVRAVMHHKHNVSREGETQLYKLAITEERPGSRLEWTSQANYNAREYHILKLRTQGRPKDVSNAAETFLKKYLANGPKKANDIKSAASTANISGRTLERAKKKMKIKSIRPKGVRKWRLP